MKKLFLTVLLFLGVNIVFGQSSQIFDLPVVLNGITNQINNAYAKDNFYLNNTNILDLINQVTNKTEQYYLHKTATNTLVSQSLVSNSFLSYVSTNNFPIATNTTYTNNIQTIDTNMYNIGKVCLIARNTNDQTVASSSTHVFTNWSNNYINENNSFTNSTGYFTVKTNGYYIVGASCVGNASAAYPAEENNGRRFIILINNNIEAYQTGFDRSTQTGYSCTWSGYLTNGQTVAVAMRQYVGSTLFTDLINMTFWIMRIKQ